MAPLLLYAPSGGGGAARARSVRQSLKEAKGEEAIKARLRQLTEHTRRVRKELEQMISRDAEALRAGPAPRLPKRKPR